MQSSMRSQESPRPRYGGSKVRSGCLTCKARHIKCDEGRPSCQRCVASKRQCRGYAQSEPRQNNLSFVIYRADRELSRNPSPFPGLDGQGKRHFDYFRHCTAIELGGPFSPGIWSTILLQASHAEPAVVHAIVAIGALHEDFGRQVDARPASSADAMRHYSRAIRRAIDLDLTISPQHFDIALMLCILFTAFESLRGHYNTALTHVIGGLKIFTEKDETTGQQRRGSLPRDLFQPVFTRLEVQLTEIDDESPTPTTSSPSDQQLPPLPHAFENVEEAQISFDMFAKSLMRLLASDEFTPTASLSSMETSPSLSLYNYLLKYFANWNAAFDRSTIPRSHPAALILQTNREMFLILQSSNCKGGEVSWDSLDPRFDKLLHLAEAVIFPHQQGNLPAERKTKPTFTFNLGIIAPLYLTCTRCRNPRIRRRALHLLSISHRKEGIWDNVLAARIAERIIRLEEASTVEDNDVVMSDSPQISENARVTESDGFFGDEQNNADKTSTG